MKRKKEKGQLWAIFEDFAQNYLIGRCCKPALSLQTLLLNQYFWFSLWMTLFTAHYSNRTQTT